MIYDGVKMLTTVGTVYVTLTGVNKIFLRLRNGRYH